MAEKIELSAGVRTTVGRGIKALRREGKVPAVIYGAHVQPTSVELNSREATNTLRKAGRNSLISLKVGDLADKMVLAREVQRHPVRHEIMHIDFLEVDMNTKLIATVHLSFFGESADVKGGLGVVNREMDELRIRCLPQDLIEEIKVDISKLNVDQAIHVRELAIPAGLEVLDDKDAEVVRVNRFVEAKEALPGATSAEVEVIEKGKKDEEGAAAAGGKPAAGGKAAPAKAAAPAAKAPAKK
jgi:large subunit ribosomal protein L25